MQCIARTDILFLRAKFDKNRKTHSRTVQQWGDSVRLVFFFSLCDPPPHQQNPAPRTWQVIKLRVLCVDIDECAKGGEAEACNEHGVCEGAQPAGNWTCACKPGYELSPNRTVCTCQYYSRSETTQEGDKPGFPRFLENLCWFLVSFFLKILQTVHFHGCRQWP